MDWTLFSWLHLSDIHFGEPGAAVRQRKELVLTDLLHALPHALEQGMPQPDVIFVTGDIAFSGAAREPDEYARAQTWLASVARAINRTAKDVYLVPGNHDVQRARADAPRVLASLNAVRDGTTALDDALSQPESRDALLSRVERYHAFARGHADGTAPTAEELRAGRLDWSHVRVQGGLRVRVFGLDSALLANDEDRQERGRLHLGSRQLLELTKTVRQEELVIVLTHHPLDYLRHSGEAHRIKRHTHIHLSGHVHEQDDTYLRSGAGGEIIRVAAGAVHASDAEGPIELGFSFGAVVAEPRSEALTLRIWPWKHTEKHHGFHLDRNSVPDKKDCSEHSLGVIHRAQPTLRTPEAIVQLATWLHEACAPDIQAQVLARASDLGATGGMVVKARRGDWAPLLWKVNEMPGQVDELFRGIQQQPPR